MVDPRLWLDVGDIEWIDATVGAPVPDLPDAVSRQMNGICSSGSTGTPKVIVSERPALHDPQMSVPFMTMWTQVPRPQDILVLAPIYHANGFTTPYSLINADRLTIMRNSTPPAGADLALSR